MSTITNSTFVGNYADNVGGAIYCGMYSTVTITNSTIASNTDNLLAAGSDGVDLIDKYNTRRFFLGLFKKIANPRSSYSNKHLHKIGAAQA